MRSDQFEGDWERVGWIGVDSGQMMLIDPCYIDSQWKKEDYSGGTEPAVEDISYNAACKLTLGAKRGGVMGKYGLAYVSSTNYGDGNYPVYIQRDSSGKPLRMMIDFDPQEEGEEDDDD